MMIPVLLLVIVAVLGSAGMVAILGNLFSRVSRLEGNGRGRSKEVGRGPTEYEELREQMEVLRSEMHRLEQRVDFTEKLLEGPRERPGESEESEESGTPGTPGEPGQRSAP